CALGALSLRAGLGLRLHGLGGLVARRGDLLLASLRLGLLRLRSRLVLGLRCLGLRSRLVLGRLRLLDHRRCLSLLLGRLRLLGRRWRLSGLSAGGALGDLADCIFSRTCPSATARPPSSALSVRTR